MLRSSSLNNGSQTVGVVNKTVKHYEFLVITRDIINMSIVSERNNKYVERKVTSKNRLRLFFQASKQYK